MRVHEDNQAIIQCVKTGKNPTMRYLHRTHRVSVGWLHERFQGEQLDLVYEVTTRMCADIYTKTFDNADKWKHACWLIGLVNPKDLVGMIEWMEALPGPDAKASAKVDRLSGGMAHPSTACAVSMTGSASVSWTSSFSHALTICRLPNMSSASFQ